MHQPDVEALLAECIEAFEEGGPRALAAILSQHPDRAALVRDALHRLEATGMIGELRPASVPEKLGEFEIISHLGSGGMGSVWLARQTSVDRLVALKLIHPSLAMHPAAAARFRREAQLIGKLDHQNIVRVIASGTDGGVLYLAMELVPGLALDELLAADDRKPTVRELVEWGRDLARALGAAHRVGLVHRDVKPSNVRITPTSRAMLLDFGLARDVDARGLTRTGAFQGSPNYASPEQVGAAAGAVDARTDVYSLAVTMIQALTGEVPFAAETDAKVFARILHDPPPRIRQLNPEVPRDLENILLRAMDRDPSRRYTDGDDLGDDLDRLLTLRPVLARPAPPLHRLRLLLLRNKALAAAAAAVVVAVAAAFVLTLAEARRTARQAARVQVVNEFMLDTLGWADPHRYGGTTDLTVREAIELAADHVEVRFAGEPDLEASVRLIIGDAMRSVGRPEEAEEHLRRARDLRLGLFGPGHLDVAEVEHHLALLHLQQQNHAKAAALLRDTLATFRRELGADDLRTATVLLNLGSCLIELDRIDEAEGLLEQAVPLLRAHGPEGIGRSGTALGHLAVIARRRGDRAQEADLLRQVLAAYAATGFADHPFAGIARHNLAMALWSLDEPAAALPHSERACEILTAAYGADDERTRALITRRERIRAAATGIRTRR